MAYKHDYTRALERYTTILSRLNNGEALSVKELAEEFDVSTRTIQRDFNEYLTKHYPIYLEKKKWRMQDGVKLEKITSIEDAVVLDIMQKLIEGAGTTFASKANKLLAKIKNESLNPIYAKLDMEDIGDNLKELEELEPAITAKHQITCKYALKGDIKEFKLKPLKIANYEGFWYLVAVDLHDDILKKFYLKNIKQITVLDETFETTKKLDRLLDNSISVWFTEEVEPYKVILQVSSTAAKYFKRKPISKSQMTEAVHQDGSMVLSVEITHDMEIIPFVKYWMPHVKVLEPLRIRESIQNDITSYLDEQ